MGMASETIDHDAMMDIYKAFIEGEGLVIAHRFDTPLAIIPDHFSWFLVVHGSMQHAKT